MQSCQRCPTCYLPREVCICAEITSVPCGVEIVVLRHALERRKPSNTGRLIGAVLRSATVVDYATTAEPMDTGFLAAPGTALLYPRKGAAAEPPKRLIVLDGSWSQARKMAQRIPELVGMPTLALSPPEEPLPRMRNGRSAEQMSTAESAVAALRQLGEHAAANHLETTLRELVRRFALPMRKRPV